MEGPIFLTIVVAFAVPSLVLFMSSDEERGMNTFMALCGTIAGLVACWVGFVIYHFVAKYW